MLAFWALGAFAGMVSYEELPLSDVISSADAAVVVRLDDPAMRHVEIPVPGSAEKSCGTYAYGVWRVTVEEVVRAPSRGPELSAGDVINVFPGNTPDLVSLTALECLEGTRKSPIFMSFSGESPDAGRRLLVLLSWSPPYGWVEAVEGAWIAPSRAKAVRRGEAMTFERAAPEPLLCVDDADCATGACLAMQCTESSP